MISIKYNKNSEVNTNNIKYNKYTYTYRSYNIIDLSLLYFFISALCINVNCNNKVNNYNDFIFSRRLFKYY